MRRLCYSNNNNKMKENTLHDMNDMKIWHTSATVSALTKQRQEEIKKLCIYKRTEPQQHSVLGDIATKNPKNQTKTTYKHGMQHATVNVAYFVWPVGSEFACISCK